MPVITKPANIQKNVPASFSLDKADLAALPSVAADAYFSNTTNWNQVLLFYRSDVGNQKEVVKFDATQTSPTANFLASSKARNIFQIQKILISDFDNGIFEVPRSALNVAEFDVDLSPLPTLLYEINPISNVAGIELLAGSGRGLVSISQPIYVTSIELKFRYAGSQPNTGQNVQDLRVRIVSQDGAIVLANSATALDISASEIVQEIPSLATWRVFTFSTPVLVSDAKLAIRFDYSSIDRVNYFVSSITANEVGSFDPGIRVNGYNA